MFGKLPDGHAMELTVQLGIRVAEQLAARAGASPLIPNRLALRSKTLPQKMDLLKRVEIGWAGTWPAMACHSAPDTRT